MLQMKYYTNTLIYRQHMLNYLQQQQQQPYQVNPTNSDATHRVWGGWDVDRPCLYPWG
ncbi:hypothetical protein Hanom_Chr10g00955821 [Helianthus anomalus]